MNDLSFKQAQYPFAAHSPEPDYGGYRRSNPVDIETVASRAVGARWSGSDRGTGPASISSRERGSAPTLSSGPLVQPVSGSGAATSPLDPAALEHGDGADSYASEETGTGPRVTREPDLVNRDAIAILESVKNRSHARTTVKKAGKTTAPAWATGAGSAAGAVAASTATTATMASTATATAGRSGGKRQSSATSARRIARTTSATVTTTVAIARMSHEKHPSRPSRSTHAAHKTRKSHTSHTSHTSLALQATPVSKKTPASSLAVKKHKSGRRHGAGRRSEAAGWELPSRREEVAEAVSQRFLLRGGREDELSWATVKEHAGEHFPVVVEQLVNHGKTITLADLAEADQAMLNALAPYCGAELVARPANALCLLTAAACKGSAAMLDALRRHGVKFSRCNASIPDGQRSLLLLAVIHGHDGVARYLADQGVRCKLSELARASAEVLGKLLELDRETLTRSHENREQVLLELMRRKPLLEARPIDGAPYYHEPRRAEERRARDNALDCLLTLLNNGARVTPAALSLAVETRQPALAFDMLQNFIDRNDLKKVWASADSAWEVVRAAVSIGCATGVETLLKAKPPESWRLESATAVLSHSEWACQAERKKTGEYSIYLGERHHADQMTARIQRRDRIREILQEDRRQCLETLARKPTRGRIPLAYTQQ